MLKKIFVFLIFIGLSFGNDFDKALEDLIFLNYQITQNRLSQNLDNISLLEEEKTYELKKLTLGLLTSKDSFRQDIDTLTAKQNKLRNLIQKQVRKDSKTSLLKEHIEISSLELLKIMQGFALELQENIGIFSQEKDVVEVIQKTLQELDKQQKFESQKPNEEIQRYQETLKTYKEILNYFLEHPRTLLPQNAFLNLGVGWILQKIMGLVPIKGSSLFFAKLLLSIFSLVVLLACRRFIARLIFSLINFFMHLSKKGDELRDTICKDIVTPITYVLLVASFDIAISILYYPNVPTEKIEVWFGVSYIALSVWFFITLLKSYGVGLMGNILQKKDGFRKEAINLILKISYFIIFLIGLLITLKYLGFNVSTIMASLGIGGLAVALALKDMLANFFASVMLLFENSFSQGDWIVCDGIEGTVVEMGLRRTTIRTFDNALVLVPNSALANSAIKNWNRRKVGRRIKMSIGVTYDSPMQNLRQCIKDIKTMLLEHPDIAKSNEKNIEFDHYELALRQNIVSMQDLLGYKDNLFVVLDTFEDSSINILVYCFSKSVVWGEFLNIKEDVMFKIMSIVEKNNLSFAFPSQSIYVESMPSEALQLDKN
ncbi:MULTISPECIES: mechanosensitive ion channel family protein [unclassified Helicobacter]|uniref:mechanosensitive ion channel family protein n=1 Tax=unclassified Helicobacter TaxID=2593540 RepID=UPI000CF19A7B|nr:MULTISPECIES: mechanosensitive ion channel family protein [unclassified Helicobacter]